MVVYDPRDWYWIVDDRQVYASAEQGYVPSDDATYLGWIESGGVPTKIDTEDSLISVLRTANVPPYNQVSTLEIVQRLEAAGKLAAVDAELASKGLYAQSQWSVATTVFADDDRVREVLTAAGADPDVILAPQTGPANVPVSKPIRRRPMDDGRG